MGFVDAGPRYCLHREIKYACTVVGFGHMVLMFAGMVSMDVEGSYIEKAVAYFCMVACLVIASICARGDREVDRLCIDTFL